MPTKSPAQHRLMEAAAHTPGGYGGVSQAVGKEFVGKDCSMNDYVGKLDAVHDACSAVASRLDADYRITSGAEPTAGRAGWYDAVVYNGTMRAVHGSHPDEDTAKRRAKEWANQHRAERKREGK